eukprot:CAMPEP_0194307250 /NCGR_PEP_ID=MMETSP0171-20130528/4130_1 /TAXON_ID=218684 /ORGANISM="Corethron pennatum, Strain L29A3" /LENGTH=49 /DNA_ID= /DNA_START= /DNA_END= /DNA_ORIENTATION=
MKGRAVSPLRAESSTSSNTCAGQRDVLGGGNERKFGSPAVGEGGGMPMG